MTLTPDTDISGISGISGAAPAPSANVGRPDGDVIVATTPLSEARSAELRDLAAAGGTIVVAPTPGDAVAAELCGACVVDVFQHGEWFVTLADRPEAIRLNREVPIFTELRTLNAVGTDTVIAATTSVRFEHHTTITVRRVGNGCVVGTGIADVATLLAHRTLGTYVHRLLRPDFPTDTRPLGVAVVGYGPFGGMGYLHGLAATETNGLAFVAAADNSPDRIEAARLDFPDLVGHDSATSLATNDSVDVAVIATPPKFHAELAVELLRAGKHVVMEKPMALTRADADLVIATAAEHDRTVTVHQSRRWDTDFLAVQRLMNNGDLGEVFNIETFVGGFEHPCRAWHSEDSVSGGAVYDWGSHHIDWINQLYGSMPSRVLCSTHTRVWHDTTNVDQLSVWMQWPDGREATFRQSDVCAIRRPKFHIEGTVATLEGHYRPLRTDAVLPGRGHVEHNSHHAEAPAELTVARYDGEHGIVTSQVRPAPDQGWGFHRNLADHISLGEPLAVRPEQSRDVVAVLEAAHQSGAEGGSLIEL